LCFRQRFPGGVDASFSTSRSSPFRRRRPLRSRRRGRGNYRVGALVLETPSAGLTQGSLVRIRLLPEVFAAEVEGRAGFDGAVAVDGDLAGEAHFVFVADAGEHGHGVKVKVK